MMIGSISIPSDPRRSSFPHFQLSGHSAQLPEEPGRCRFSVASSGLPRCRTLGSLLVLCYPNLFVFFALATVPSLSFLYSDRYCLPFFSSFIPYSVFVPLFTHFPLQSPCFPLLLLDCCHSARHFRRPQLFLHDATRQMCSTPLQTVSLSRLRAK